MKKISTLFKKDPKNHALVINEINPENQWVFDSDYIATRKYDGTACAIINGELYKRYDAKLRAIKEIVIGDIVSKPSRNPFKNGYMTDEVIRLEINENDPKKRMGAYLKNSETVVNLYMLQAVGKFSNEYIKPIPVGAIPCQEPDLISGHHPHWVKCDINKKEDKYFIEGYNSLAELGKVEDGTYELIGEKVQGNPEKIEGHHLVKHGNTILELESLDFEYLKTYLSDSTNDIEGIVFHHKSDGRMCKLRKSDFGIIR